MFFFLPHHEFTTPWCFDLRMKNDEKWERTDERTNERTNVRRTNIRPCERTSERTNKFLSTFQVKIFLWKFKCFLFLDYFQATGRQIPKRENERKVEQAQRKFDSQHLLSWFVLSVDTYFYRRLSHVTRDQCNWRWRHILYQSEKNKRRFQNLLGEFIIAHEKKVTWYHPITRKL